MTSCTVEEITYASLPPTKARFSCALGENPAPEIVMMRPPCAEPVVGVMLSTLTVYVMVGNAKVVGDETAYPAPKRTYMGTLPPTPASTVHVIDVVDDSVTTHTVSLKVTTGVSSGRLVPDIVTTVPCVTFAGEIAASTTVALLDASIMHPEADRHDAAAAPCIMTDTFRDVPWSIGGSASGVKHMICSVVYSCF